MLLQGVEKRTRGWAPELRGMKILTQGLFGNQQRLQKPTIIAILAVA